MATCASGKPNWSIKLNKLPLVSEATMPAESLVSVVVFSSPATRFGLGRWPACEFGLLSQLDCLTRLDCSAGATGSSFSGLGTCFEKEVGARGAPHSWQNLL